MNTPKTKPRRLHVLLAVAAGLLLLAAYFVIDYVSYFYDLGESGYYWNTLTLDLLTILSAGAATAMGIRLARQFDPGDNPRRVWLWFTAGWGAWFIGEIVSSSYDLFSAWTIPDIAPFDIFWTLGYLCFGLALYYQFRLIYSGRKRLGKLYYILLAAAILLATAGLTQWAIRAGMGEGKTWFAVYLAVFYPVCDIIEGAAAIWLSFLFGRGKWGRPWWSLIAFAIADSVNIYNWLGGLAAIPTMTAYSIYLVTDVLYNGGYVIVALAFLSSYWMVSRPPASGIQPAAKNTPAP